MQTLKSTILKLLTNYMLEADIPAMGIQVLSFLCKSEAFLELILQDPVDVFTALVVMMKTFPNNETIQGRGCMFLHMFLQKVPECELALFVENEDHRVLAAAVRGFTHHPVIVCEALSALRILALVDDNQELFMSSSERCYQLAAQAMEVTDSAIVATAACSLLIVLSRRGFGNLHVLHEVPGVVLAGLRHYVHDGTLQSTALNCLSKLAGAIYKLEEGGIRESWWWVTEASQALTLHRNNSLVQKSACEALVTFFQKWPTEVYRARATGQWLSLPSDIYLTMLVYEDDVDVFCTATEALIYIIKDSVPARRALITQGAHTFLLGWMSRHKTRLEAQEAVCRTLGVLLRGSAVMVEDLSGALSRIAFAMLRYKSTAAMQLAALQALFAFCNHCEATVCHENDSGNGVVSENSPDDCEASPSTLLLDHRLYQKVVKNQCLVEGIPRFTLQAMNTFIWNGGIQHEGLGVLWALSSAEGALEIYLVLGGLDSVLHAMQTHPSDRGIQVLCLKLLEVLIPLRKWVCTIVSLLAEVITHIIRLYPEDVEINVQACKAALVLMRRGRSGLQALVQQTFHSCILHHLRQIHLQQGQELLQLSARCIAVMTLQQDFVDQMLLEACVEGDADVAECFLLLGANVNQTTEHAGILCMVCERGDVHLAQRLLTFHFPESELRIALTHCLQHGTTGLVGSLLCKLGLDATSGVISLAGLQLAKLHPDWLRPLLVPEAKPHLNTTSIGKAMEMEILQQRILSEKAEWTLGMKENLEKEEEEEVGGGYLIDGDDTVYAAGCLQHTHKEQDFSSCVGSEFLRCPKNSGNEERSHTFPVSLDLSENGLLALDSVLEARSLESAFSNLRRLELQRNKLVRLPEQQWKILKNLVHLDLSSNNIETFPYCTLHLEHLESFNISNNRITGGIVFDSGARCKKLRHFDASNCLLGTFPQGLDSQFPELVELLLAGNILESLPNILNLPCLEFLDLSRNGLSNLIPGQFSSCLRLDNLLLSNNSIGKLESLPSMVNTLNLSHNHLSAVPPAVLSLTQLRSVNLSNNYIEEMPAPGRWRADNLRELVLSHNHLQKLQLEAAGEHWYHLEKFSANHNAITEMPSEIGQLKSLCTLDLSYNLISSLPNELGCLRHLWDFPLDGLNLDLDMSCFGGSTKDLLWFLYHRLQRAVPYRRVRLVVVGSPQSGKSTLLSLLCEQKPKEVEAGCRRDMVIRDWVYSYKEEKLVFGCWDFPGEEGYRSIVPCFMSRRNLYLVVYDASRAEAEASSLQHWFLNIKVHSPNCPVILVGTHADLLIEGKNNGSMEIAAHIRESWHSVGFSNVVEHQIVSALGNKKGICKLRATIASVACTFKHTKSQPLMVQMIPYSYLQFEKWLLRIGQQSAPPVVTQEDVLKLLANDGVDLDPGELRQALRFLHDAGVLLNFDDQSFQLEDITFLNPKWLCDVMAQLVALGKAQPMGDGCLKMSDVEHVVSTKCGLPTVYIPYLVRLLEKFHIAFSQGKDRILLLSSLPAQRPIIDLPIGSGSVVRCYSMPQFPIGFWPRFLCHVLTIFPYMFCPQGSHSPQEPNRTYWCQGILLVWSAQAYCLAEATTFPFSQESFLIITVPKTRGGIQILGQMVDHVDELVEDCFSGLLNPEDAVGRPSLLQKWALWPTLPEPRLVLLKDLQEAIDGGEEVWTAGDQSIPISTLVPDLLLRDLPDSLQMKKHDLHLTCSPQFLLGHGGFGSVYRASFKHEEVAVKVFDKPAANADLHRLMRQELAVLSRLQHPSLVSLLAASVQPRLLVMELALRGSLSGLFESKKTHLTRTSQHRIALHIADGLRFLHSSMVIYRDLKPDNVLLFTLQQHASIIAKIADYGISRHCYTSGMTSPEGTPGFRAPEVVRGKGTYNQQADVYSFGLLLYDLLTLGRRCRDGARFPLEFDEIAISGKLPDPLVYAGCAPWPGIQRLIGDCLQKQPQSRPTAAQVYNRLCTEEILGLAAVIEVPGPGIASCLTVTRTVQHETDVCVCVHRDGKAELCVLNSNGTLLWSQVFETERILCITTLHLPHQQDAWVVVGMESGSIWLVPADTPTNLQRLCQRSSAITALTAYTLTSRKSQLLLVGTADGQLLIYDASEFQSDLHVCPKELHLGIGGMPVRGFVPAMTINNDVVLWGSCGTSLFSLRGDLQVHNVIETSKTQRTINDDASAIWCLCADKYVYLARRSSSKVEIWDGANSRYQGTIDCAYAIWPPDGDANEKCIGTQTSEGATCFVCSMAVQRSIALWVGLASGRIVAFDTSSRKMQLSLAVLPGPITALTLRRCTIGDGPKLILFALGSHFGDERHVEDAHSHIFAVEASLPYHVGSLKSHIAARARLASKMSESCTA
uniref:leucine-rich repeat serine/threonine-protein kinase 2 isoform X2 n=1 Tax=Myxine glutinosa TaxID=7769 RepID=UPI003590044D